MDYVFDFYVAPNGEELSHFIYDDHRFFSKLYVFIKSMSVVFYITTLSQCGSLSIYIIINGIMCLSAANSARYEYRHHQRYGTVFSSLHDYEVWRAALWPKSRVVFSIMELSVKIGYFIYAYPSHLEFLSLCDVGKSVLLIHILIVFIIYTIFYLCLLWLYLTSDCETSYRAHVITNSPPTRLLEVAVASFQVTVTPTDQECCICLDNENTPTRQWGLLSCGHLFHAACISEWLITHDTCPVCRVRVCPGV
jgi:hypothetical protein